MRTDDATALHRNDSRVSVESRPHQHLLKPDSDAGWLDRSGRFYGCAPANHDRLAELYLGVTVHHLESAGWVRVRNAREFAALHRLSADQLNWLAMRGHHLEPTD